VDVLNDNPDEKFWEYKFLINNEIITRIITIRIRTFSDGNWFGAELLVIKEKPNEEKIKIIRL
jgi:hypothetical protein